MTQWGCSHASHQAMIEIRREEEEEGEERSA